MAPRSKIAQLPADTRARVDAYLAAEGRSVDDFLVFLTEDIGLDIARSSAHRYQQKREKVAARIRESREMTEALARELGDASSQGKQGRLLVEMARSLVFDLMMKLQDAETDEQAALDPKDVANLGKGLAELGRALRFDQDFETKVREEVHRKAIAKLDEAVEEADAAGEPGLSADRIAQLRRDFLGVRPK